RHPARPDRLHSAASAAEVDEFSDWDGRMMERAGLCPSCVRVDGDLFTDFAFKPLDHRLLIGVVKNSCHDALGAALAPTRAVLEVIASGLAVDVGAVAGRRRLRQRGKHCSPT